MAERFLQNSYWVRKFRTRIHYLDTDKDGVITRNDLVLLADRMAQKGKMSAEGEERIRRNVMDIWKAYGVPDDAVIKPEELLRMMAESLAGKLSLAKQWRDTFTRMRNSLSWTCYGAIIQLLLRCHRP